MFVGDSTWRNRCDWVWMLAEAVPFHNTLNLHYLWGWIKGKCKSGNLPFVPFLWGIWWYGVRWSWGVLVILKYNYNNNNFEASQTLLDIQSRIWKWWMSVVLHMLNWQMYFWGSKKGWNIYLLKAYWECEFLPHLCIYCCAVASVENW